MSPLLSLALMLTAVPAAGQAQARSAVEASAVAPSAVEASAVEPSTVDPPAVHVTDVINHHPAARSAREAFVTRGPASAKAGTAYRIGQTQTFKVYNVAASKHAENLQLDVLPFTLMAEGDRFRIWVETAEIEKGHVRSMDVAALHEALNSRTPDRSIAPESGIMANDEALFGAPPDVDGDGATDVLLVDIRDGYTPGDGYVAGFVWHGDLDPHSTQGNGRDVLYIDTYPGMYRDGSPRGTHRAEATAAHEYQHLIHLGYDRNELTFVNEGLSEWAEAANGYADHAPTYLTRPAAHNVGLLDWHDYEPGLRLDDYARAGLFTTYLAQRVGAASVQRLVHAGRGGKALVGADGYRALLGAAGLSLEEIVADFHTANVLNDREIDPNYGYADPVHQHLPFDPTQLFDGRDARNTNVGDLTLRPGGVTYLSWRYVGDFQFQASSHAGGSAVRFRAILSHTDGRVEVRDFSPGSTLRSLSGDFRRVTLALIHTTPDADPVSVSVGAVWQEGGTSGIRVEPVTYDDGRADAFFTLSGAAEGGQATRFIVPEGDARLDRLAVAPYFANQFEGTFLPKDAARDLEVRIWDAAPEGGPGDLLLSVPVTDPRPHAPAARTLTFFDIDLSPYGVSDLPDTLYIGLVNAGSDANHLVAAVSTFPPDHAPESVSYTGNAGSWKPLWEVQLLGSADPYPLRETVIPIRAEFVVTSVPHDAAPHGELPHGIALEQNYPNPFNPTATIRYRLEQAGNVQLAVYDVTGRRVATLADGLQGAGTHRVDVDGAAWASGTYVYVLESAGRRAMRTMVLAK